jgi:hypothetical protein
VAIFPGLVIMRSVLCINYIGDGLRDALDPRLSQYYQLGLMIAPTGRLARPDSRRIGPELVWHSS